MRQLELLSPAKNLQVGIAAINHGADAVYIGAPAFGARAAAANSLEDISELIQYAHQFNAKVYVALNTMEELRTLPGIGEVKAVKLLCLSEIARRIGFAADSRSCEYATQQPHTRKG